MKLFLVLLLPSLLAAGLIAQAPSSDFGGLAVLKKKWAFEIRNPSLEQDPIQETADRQEAERQRIDIERRNEMLRARGMPTLPVPPPLPPARADIWLPRPGPLITYIYTVQFRNNAAKEIRAITWEYVFSAADTGKEVGRRRFVSRSALRPGRSASVTLRSPTPPTGTIDAASTGTQPGSKFTERINVVSVEFADGSKWPN